MKCTECGNAMTKSVGDHIYRESGLEHVTLRNVTTYNCESCGAKSVQIVAMAQLHRVLAHALATKPTRLVPSEVRFLRDHLELTNKDFATVMGVGESQASRWTTSDSMGVPAERFLRMLATMGPFEVVGGVPNVTLGKIENGKFVEDVRSTLANLPPRDAPVTDVPIRVRRVNVDWKQEPLITS